MICAGYLFVRYSYHENSNGRDLGGLLRCRTRDGINEGWEGSFEPLYLLTLEPLDGVC